MTPTGQDVETIAIAMAAAAGISWQAAAPEQRQHFRILGNAALIRLAIAGRGTDAPPEQLAAVLAEIEASLAAAASQLDLYGNEHADLVARIYRTKATAALLAGMFEPPPEETV